MQTLRFRVTVSLRLAATLKSLRSLKHPCLARAGCPWRRYTLFIDNQMHVATLLQGHCQRAHRSVGKVGRSSGLLLRRVVGVPSCVSICNSTPRLASLTRHQVEAAEHKVAYQAMEVLP